MSTITFDTLKFVDRLEKAGATRELATAMAEAQKESLSEVMDAQLATKSDVAKLESRFIAVDSKMVSIENRLEAMELRLTIKLGAFLAVFAGIIIAALKAF
jgi:hypothetical protein